MYGQCSDEVGLSWELKQKKKNKKTCGSNLEEHISICTSRVDFAESFLQGNAKLQFV